MKICSTQVAELAKEFDEFKEMNTCTTQVAKLAKEFEEFKKVVEATLSDIDATRFIVIELTIKLKNL